MKPIQHIQVKNKLETGEDFKISRFKEVIKRTKPHTHQGYYELIYIREGAGFHLVESKNYPVSVPELYLLKPGQLHCWQFTTIPKGYVVLFKESFFDPVSESPVLELLKQLNDISRTSLNHGYQPDFLFEEMLNEFNHTSDYSIHIIHSHLRAIFSRMLQLSDRDKSHQIFDTLSERFLKLLVEKCPDVHQVNEYAQLLNTSPQNLNASCRKYTGRSAGEHIAIQRLLESKRYILHTDLNINQIADELQFSDTSYFIKFFKKLEGITPHQYRAQHFQ
jgi:AraC family transcriptional regulator, transcriptional activator of pobA